MKGYAVAPDCLGSGGNTSDRENLGAEAHQLLQPRRCQQRPLGLLINNGNL